MRDEAIAEYHRLLEADDSLTPELFARLRAAMRAGRMLYGGREIGVALRPHLLTREQYARLARASELVASAFEKLAAAFAAEPALMEEVGMTGRERRYAEIEPGYACPAVSTRLDAFVRGDSVKFVEYNAENPSSLTDQAALNRVMFEVPALARFAERYRLGQFDPEAALLASLLETFREWSGGRQDAPRVAIVDWPNLPTRHEFELLRNYFVSRGVPTIICAPDELEYAGGGLRRGDFAVDLVYKRVIIHELFARCEDSHPLLRAYRDGRVCLVNSFRCKPVHKKAGFELLTDDERDFRLTPDEREAVRACVPWTRRVSERRTTRRGGRFDLVPHLRAERSSLVLKPNDDYGGHGLVIGPRATESEWDDAIETALGGDYVVQEVIELHTEEFPVFDERRWSLQPMYVDTNPFLFRGRAEGAMVRLSDSPVVNVTAGGGEAGFFVIEGRVSSN
ncbi:MAG TPA: hypothetical protein VG148_13125 [Pyrinomonadaceae bacterium]|nr:hypothetical protein [Pyrinomonadaceae bacterium]